MQRAKRPLDFTQELADTICEALGECHSLTTICKRSGMPTKGTVFRWITSIPEFKNQYASAREVQAHAIADKVRAVADKSTSETSNADRVKIDAYKWLAGKLAPKVFGTEKQTVQHEVGETFSDLIMRSYSEAPKRD